jgi:hypothetical protein
MPFLEGEKKSERESNGDNRSSKRVKVMEKLYFSS